MGWPGVLDGEVDGLRTVLEREKGNAPYRLEPVSLTRSERRYFYEGFSNEVLWPLFHGLLGRCRFEPRFWEAYQRVNRKFAQSILRVAEPEHFIWVHDYHLISVGEELRAAGSRNRIGFFLHIPFPYPPAAPPRRSLEP